jgi:hypothetical protein
MRFRTLVVSAVLLAGGLVASWHLAIEPAAFPAGRRKAPLVCPVQIEVRGDEALRPVTVPPGQACRVRTSNGFPIPDPACTPGAINPSLTVDVLRDPHFRTACLRNKATSKREKAETYGWYAISHPAHNQGKTQTCELDHLVSLELGGADTLDNIWPQCGPEGVGLRDRYFKQKDIVENFLAYVVKTGQMDLGTAQKGIASDWPQYLKQAKQVCPGGVCPRVKRR